MQFSEAEIQVLASLQHLDGDRRRAFGEDLRHEGRTDIGSLNHRPDLLRLAPGDSALDLGCGAGANSLIREAEEENLP